AAGDLHGHPDRVPGAGLLDDGVVEGHVPASGTSAELDIESHALFDEIVACEHPVERLLDAGRLDRGEVTHPAQVHAQHGHPRGEDEFHGAQHRPVTTETHSELHAVSFQEGYFRPGAPDLDHLAALT